MSIADLPANVPSVSRRALIGGIAAAGAATVATLASAGSASGAPAAEPVLAAPVEGLIYLPVDAFAFDVAGVSNTSYRLYQASTGMQPEPPAAFLYAPLPIPVGSVIKQLNVYYQGQPVVNVKHREFTANPAALVDLTPPTTLAAAGGGPKSQTLTANAALTAGASYSLAVFCSAGDSILGATIGYVPPAQGFVPFVGTAALGPRVLDTRSGAKFAVDEERVIDLSSRLIPSARAAVVNITATGTGGFGFLSAYQDGIAWPGNSTVNYTAPDQTVANAAVVTMVAGKIKVRCGNASAHVIIDVVGALL
jgi:hypothetical protein